MKKTIPHFIILSLIAAIALAGLNAPIHSKLTEYRFKLFPRAATGTVVLVAIDAKSIQETAKWPWPRSLHARLIDKLESAGATDIAFDIDFSSKTTTTEDDALLKALKKANGSIILPSFNQVQSSYGKASSIILTKPLPKFMENSWLASVNIFPGRNGLVNEIPYGQTVDGEYIPSISSILSGIYQSKTDNFHVDFSIQASTIPVLPYVDVLKNRVNKEIFKNKKVIVGATATELGDHFFVPNQGMISGPMLQALATETLLQNRPMYQTKMEVSFIGVIILSLLIFAASLRFKLSERLYLFAVAAASIEIAALLLHLYSNLIIDTSLWHLILMAYFISTLIYEIDFRKVIAQISHQELANTQQMFEQVFNDSFTGTIITNENGTIQVASNTAARMLDYPHDQTLEGLHYKDVFPIDMITAANRLLAQQSSTESIHYSSHTDIQSEDGLTKTIEFIVTLSLLNNEKDIHHQGGQHILTFSFQDVTARHNAEITQKEATLAAINANKAKTEFLTTMSHELRTPLNSILGFSEIIEKQSLGPDQMDKYIEFAHDIQNSGRQLLSVVNNILEVTRMESGSVQLSESNCNLIDIIEDAIEELTYQFKDQPQNIMIEQNNNLPIIYADAQLCQKTFSAIISNAIKFSPPGEEIRIATQINDQGQLSVMVIDKGQGISRNEIDNIFKPFYQIDSSLERNHEGTGLGLTAANAYIQLHGGNIKVDSTISKGTTMHITFPKKRIIATECETMSHYQPPGHLRHSA